MDREREGERERGRERESVRKRERWIGRERKGGRENHILICNTNEHKFLLRFWRLYMFKLLYMM